MTHGSVKIHSPVEAAKIHQQVPRDRRLHSRFAHRKQNVSLLDPAGNPLPVITKARLVIQGQHCPDIAHGLVRTDAGTAHRTAVSVCLVVFFRTCILTCAVQKHQNETTFLWREQTPPVSHGTVQGFQEDWIRSPCRPARKPPCQRRVLPIVTRQDPMARRSVVIFMGTH